MNPKLSWYVARSGGLVAWALLTVAVVWGLALRTRLLGNRPTPQWLLDLHRGLGGLATVFTGVHVAALLADDHVRFGAADVLVPFASEWRPGAVALGIVALYLLLAVEVTSLLQRRLPRRLWFWVHQLSLPLWLVSGAHLLAAGTDVRSPTLVWTLIASTAGLAFLTLVRVLSPRRRQPARPGSAKRPARGGGARQSAGVPGRGTGSEFAG